MQLTRKHIIVFAIVYVVVVGYLLFKIFNSEMLTQNTGRGDLIPSDFPRNPSPVTPTATPTPLPLEVEVLSAPDETYVFIDGSYSLNIIKPDGERLVIADNVTKYSYNKKIGKIAYINGPSHTEYTVEKQDSVYLYDILTTENKLILTHPYTEINEVGKVDAVYDVAFIPDGSKIYVSALKQFYEFDNEGQSLRTISTGYEEVDHIGGTWAIYSILPNETGTRAIFVNGLWEGANDGLVDFSTGTVRSTDFTRYIGGGEAMYGWYDNDSLIVGTMSYGEDGYDKVVLSRHDATTLAEIGKIDLPTEEVAIQKVHNGTVIYTQGLEKRVDPQNTYSYKEYALMAHNLNAQETKEIMRIEVRPNNQKESVYFNEVLPLDNTNTIFVTTYRWRNGQKTSDVYIATMDGSKEPKLFLTYTGY